MSVNPLQEPKVLGRVIDFHLDKRPPSQVQEDIVRRYANRHSGGRMTWSVGNPSPQFVVSAFVASAKFTDDEKVRILNPILTAVKTGDYSPLIVESGDEPAPEPGRVNPLTIDVPATPAPAAVVPATPVAAHSPTATPAGSALVESVAKLYLQACEMRAALRAVLVGLGCAEDSSEISEAKRLVALASGGGK